MKPYLRTLLAFMLCGLSTCAFAEGISNADESFLRGFFDQQWLAVGYDQLALKKGSTELVRKFAQSELDMYQSLGAKMEAVNKAYGLIDISAKTGTLAPKTGEGTTRGFTTLPEGAKWAGVSVLGTLAGGGRLDTNANALVNDTAMLDKLSGEQFDKEYLLRIIMAHQRMMRHTLREMQPAGGNADVVAFAKTALATLNQQNESAENLYHGRSNPTGPPPTP